MRGLRSAILSRRSSALWAEEISERGAQQIPAEALGGLPDDASRFQTERSSVALGFDGSAALDNMTRHYLIGLLLFGNGAETVHTGIAVGRNWAGVVGDDIPVGVDQDRGCRQLGERLPHDGIRGGSK